MKTLAHTFRVLFGGIILCSPVFLHAQVISVKGRILDQNTSLPISFATVSICGTSIGVVSNETGDFILNVPSTHSQDTICISSIGYETSRFSVFNRASNINIITLVPQPYILPPVEISEKAQKQLQAWKIVRRAIRSIRNNYPQEDFTQTGYYRDYQKVDEEYLNLMEAALVVHDPGFHKRDFYHSEVKLIQFRYAPGFEIDTSLQGGYSEGENSKKFLPGAMLRYSGGNEWAILRLHDPIRNHRWKSFSFIDFLRKDFIPNHTFSQDSLSYLNGNVIHCISFVYKDYLINRSGLDSEYSANGNIYIQAGTFDIVQMNYQIHIKSPLYEGKLCELQLAYKPYKKKMYLNYLSFSNYFEIWTRTEGITTRQSAIQYREFFVNETLEGISTHFSHLSPLDKEIGLMDIPTQPLFNFWEEYNYIRVKPLQE